MNQMPETSTSLERTALGRRIFIGMGVILLVGVLGFGGLMFWHVYASPQARHTQLLRRIDSHAQAVLAVLHFRAHASDRINLRGDDRTRSEALKVVDKALWNALYRYQHSDRDLLHRIADRLDRTKAAELQSAEGCLRLLDEIEEACITVKDYSEFAYFRRLQAEGIVGKLPAKK